MEINPYASPAEFPAALDQPPLVRPLALVACLGVFFLSLHYYLTPLIYADVEKLFLAESAIMAILGIATFNSFARAIEDARFMYAGRAVCVMQLIATAAMPLLDWRLRDICIVPCALLFASAIVTMLHLTLKRFEQLPTAASRWTFRAMIPIYAATILIISLRVQVAAIGFLPGGLAALTWLTAILGQALICILLTLRILAVRQTWRSEAQPQGRDDHEAA